MQILQRISAIALIVLAVCIVRKVIFESEF